MSIAIVIPCYKKITSLKELCKTLIEADYSNDNVDLIFSIDYSGTSEVYEFADNFIWTHGFKNVIKHKQNIGLRNNILYCGDLTSQYDAVIVLEDDLEVTPSFYKYAKQAFQFYKNEPRIGGISIYAYHLEEMTMTEFHPCYEGYDGCLIQWASSWGQLWSREQWLGFRNWYYEDRDISNINMPHAVKQWKRSWKKYYIAYLVDTNKYFVFPYFSFVFNGNKKGGEHTSQFVYESLTSSPLNFSNKDFHFGTFETIHCKYDVYFQHNPVEITVDDTRYLCELDLYGHKEQCVCPYIITSKKCIDKDIIYSYDASVIPLEYNIIMNKQGSTFHLISKDAFQHELRVPIESYLAIRRRLVNYRCVLKLAIDSIKKILLNKC